MQSFLKEFGRLLRRCQPDLVRFCVQLIVQRSPAVRIGTSKNRNVIYFQKNRTQLIFLKFRALVFFKPRLPGGILIKPWNPTINTFKNILQPHAGTQGNPGGAQENPGRGQGANWLPFTLLGGAPQPPDPLDYMEPQESFLF